MRMECTSGSDLKLLIPRHTHAMDENAINRALRNGGKSRRATRVFAQELAKATAHIC